MPSTPYQPPTSRQQQAQPGQRLRAIDAARGTAVVLMIATHVCDAFLGQQWRTGTVWDGFNIVFGFVAPAFTFLSGTMLWLALERRALAARAAERSNTAGPAASGARALLPPGLLRRFAGLLLLGYWLQFPMASIRRFVSSANAEQIWRAFDSNILHVIGLVGIALVLLAAACRSLQAARWCALAVGLAVAFLTPYIWANGVPTSLPAFARAYMSPTPPATFGMFPTAAYMLFGFALAPVITTAALRENIRQRTILACAGVALVAIAPMLTAILHAPNDHFWASSMQHVFYRTGGVFLLIALAGAMAPIQESSTALTPLEIAGQRSLGAYVIHLVLIYGSPLTMGLGAAFATDWGSHPHSPSVVAFAPYEVCEMFVAVLFATFTAEGAWRGLRARWPSAATLIARAFWPAILGLMLALG